MNYKSYKDGKSILKVKRAGKEIEREIIHKFCTACEKETEWYKYNRPKCRRGTGPDSRCRECSLRYSREKIRRNKENWMKWKGGCCIACGLVDDPCCFDLHHVDPSTKSFGLYQKLTRNHSPEIEAELRKCVLLCCLCHRKIENGVITLTPEQIKEGLKLTM